MARVLFVDGTENHRPDDPYKQPQGGILTSLTRVPEELVKLGHEVAVKSTYGKSEVIRGVRYLGPDDRLQKWDVTVFNRNLIDAEFVKYCKEQNIQCWWWLHDIVDYRYLKDASYQVMDKVIALSEYCKSTYKAFFGVPEEKFSVIPNGVDKSIFYPGKYEDKNPDLVVMAGALIKGFLPIDLTFHSLKKLNAALDFRIYSSQELHGKQNNVIQQQFLRDMVNAGANVRQPVPQNILAEVLRQAWLFLMPNTYPEICSNLLLQAQACGTPVISSNIGGSPEFIENEQTGIITKYYPHDMFLWCKAYAGATVRTASNEVVHKRISEQAPRNVKSWEDIGRMWSNELHKTFNR
jgi:glycosyltransferase involved in cell wall biosynthesis